MPTILHYCALGLTIALNAILSVICLVPFIMGPKLSFEDAKGLAACGIMGAINIKLVMSNWQDWQHVQIVLLLPTMWITLPCIAAVMWLR